MIHEKISVFSELEWGPLKRKKKAEMIFFLNFELVPAKTIFFSPPQFRPEAVRQEKRIF